VNAKDRSRIATLTAQLEAADRRIRTLEAVVNAQRDEIEDLTHKLRAMGVHVGGAANAIRAPWWEWTQG
jgi:uncharacterized coiled-coil protein SlyX